MRGEKLLSLTEAARWLEEELGIKRSPQTVHAWIFYSRRGIKLEAVSLAGQWYTSGPAIKRFIAACTRQHSDEAGAQVSELQL